MTIHSSENYDKLIRSHLDKSLKNPFNKKERTGIKLVQIR